ncbi:MAG: hypothetical protein A2Y17_00585 [Clostridiales bacterium GWF2_38_85]|nr:MAG: hypothetical protein A2Y17_00585 [Clostridiales bacterium GWF2_38_85]HBL84598.1 hypothetical protein [Clostridiales bacterium]
MEESIYEKIDRLFSYLYCFVFSSVHNIVDRSPTTGKYIGYDYVRSNKTEDIVANSKYIFRLKVDKFIDEVTINNTERYTCSIVESLKGNVVDKSIEVIFSKGTVELGKEYIVLLDNKEHSIFYTLSSKNSVKPVEDFTLIKELLNASR